VRSTQLPRERDRGEAQEGNRVGWPELETPLRRHHVALAMAAARVDRRLDQRHAEVAGQGECLVVERGQERRAGVERRARVADAARPPADALGGLQHDHRAVARA
jgi:hypothetical protein